MPEQTPNQAARRPAGQTGTAKAAAVGRSTTKSAPVATATAKAGAIGRATAKAGAVGTAKTGAVGRATAKAPAVGAGTAKNGAVGRTTRTGVKPVTSRQSPLGKTTGKLKAVGPGSTTKRRAVVAQSVARRKKTRLRNNIGIFLLLLAIFLMTGPFPADNTPWQQSDYGTRTLATLAGSQPSLAEGQLLAGIGTAEITPVEGQPLMGYSDRKPLGSSGTLSPCYAKALTLGTNKIAVTIVSIDALLIMEDLAEEVLRRTGLRHDEVYFTATHTHSGPGGWAKGKIVEFVYGKYESMYFDRLATQISKAVKDSRAPDSLRPATLSFASVDAPDYVGNRIYGDLPGRPPLTTLSALIVRDPDKTSPRVILTSYAAHATVIRRDEHRASADYPGALCDILQKRTKAEMVMFAAGAVGDARPKAEGERSMSVMANGLATKLLPALEKAKEIKTDRILTWSMLVDMPKARVALGPNWKLFPFFSPHLMPLQAHLSLLQLGDFVLCGWPADVAGEVARPVQEQAAKAGQTLLITSFNGNWEGYFTLPETYQNISEYETRMVGFMGPQAGVYFSDLTNRMLERAKKTQ